MDVPLTNPPKSKELLFDEGTLVLSGALRNDPPPSSKFWKWREETDQWHTDAYRYPALLDDTSGIADRVPGWSSLMLSTRLPEVRDYQRGGQR